jgi:hypothetical protein
MSYQAPSKHMSLQDQGVPQRLIARCNKGGAASGIHRLMKGFTLKEP